MFSTNKHLLQIKLLYFLTFAGLCPLTSFGPTLAKQLGFSTSAVGLMYSVSIVLSIFARLIFGYVADKFQKHKTLLISCILTCACSILLLPLFPQKKIPLVFLSFNNQDRTSFVLCFPNRDSAAVLEWNKTDDGTCEVYCAERSYSMSFSRNERTTENSSAYAVDMDYSFQKLNNVCFNGRHTSKSKRNNASEEKKENFSSCSVACDSEPQSIGAEFSEPIFWLYFSVYAVYFVTNFVIGVFMDTVCFQILDSVGGKFGNQRMFASMGWGTAALISGLLTDYFSQGEHIKNYLPTCILASVFLIITAFLLIFFKMPNTKIEATATATATTNTTTTTTTTKIDLRLLRTVLWNKNSASFAFWCFFIGIYSAVVWQYGFWIIEEISNDEELAWNKSLQGIMVVLNTILGDVPTYYFFDYVISKLGYVHCMTLTLLLNAARLFVYSVLNRPIWAIFVSILDGFTFGISYATIASYANFMSTADSKTTLQAIFNSIFDGVGTSLGGLCFGFIYHWYGGAFSFRLCSFIAFSTTVLHILVSRRLRLKTDLCKISQQSTTI